MGIACLPASQPASGGDVRSTWTAACALAAGIQGHQSCCSKPPPTLQLLERQTKVFAKRKLLWPREAGTGTLKIKGKTDQAKGDRAKRRRVISKAESKFSNLRRMIEPWKLIACLLRDVRSLGRAHAGTLSLVSIENEGLIARNDYTQ